MGQREFKKTITIMLPAEQFFSQTMPDKNLIFISGQSFILMVERINSAGRWQIKAKLGEMVGGLCECGRIEAHQKRLERKLGLQWRKPGREREYE